MGGVPGLCGALRTNAKSGIYKDECGGADEDPEVVFAKRIGVFGRNILDRPPLKTFWEHCLDALEDPMLIILMIAGTVSIVLGAVKCPASGMRLPFVCASVPPAREMLNVVILLSRVVRGLCYPVGGGYCHRCQRRKQPAARQSLPRPRGGQGRRILQG